MRKIEHEGDARRQREEERRNDRFNRLSQRDRELHREQQNLARERYEAQERMQEFNEFKFNVNLEYKDEFGQEMSKKDVRCLCHDFLMGRPSSDCLMPFMAKVPER
jgi:U4/U6.U5 tri-snRNP-associated protein 1